MSGAGRQMMPGDWVCPGCGDHVFARNSACRRCATPKPGGVMMMAPGYAAYGMGPMQMAGASMGGGRASDWNCPSCGDLQFGRNASCRRCGTARPNGMVQQMMMPATYYGAAPVMVVAAPSISASTPRGQMKPGDWICPGCDDHVFAKHDACRRCSTPKPAGAGFGGQGMPSMVSNAYLQPARSAVAAQPSASQGSKSQVEPKPGDWYCPKCNDLQFARNSECRRCGTANPSGTQAASQSAASADAKSPIEPKPGDWYCPKCNDLQFARNASCRRCGAANPNGGQADGGDTKQQVQPKPGDWYCPGCADLQFAKNPACRRCGTANPLAGQAALAQMMAMQYGVPVMTAAGVAVTASGTMATNLKPGDWICPNCQDHVFARNEACRRCSTPKPATADAYGTARPGLGSQTPKPGDWQCPKCKDLQFARNSACRRCGNPKPLDADLGRQRSRSPYR